MYKLVCVLAIAGIATAQKWGNNDYDSGYRRPVQPAPLAHDGRVVDTPEIANLKAAHFAAHDAAIKAHPPQKPYYQDNYRQQEYIPQQQQQQRFTDARDYRGPQEFTNNKVNEDYEDYNERDSGYQGNNKEEPRWRGPLAKIEFTEDGKFVKDTPEVYHARQQHLAAIDAARKSPFYQKEPPTQNYEQNNYDEGRNQGYQGEGDRQLFRPNQYNNNQNFQGQGGYDDGQYRPNQGNSWQGPGNQFAGRSQGY